MRKLFITSVLLSTLCLSWQPGLTPINRLPTRGRKRLPTRGRKEKRSKSAQRFYTLAVYYSMLTCLRIQFWSLHLHVLLAGPEEAGLLLFPKEAKPEEGKLLCGMLFRSI